MAEFPQYPKLQELKAKRSEFWGAIQTQVVPMWRRNFSNEHPPIIGKLESPILFTIGNTEFSTKVKYDLYLYQFVDNCWRLFQFQVPYNDIFTALIHPKGAAVHIVHPEEYTPVGDRVHGFRTDFLNVLTEGIILAIISREARSIESVIGSFMDARFRELVNNYIIADESWISDENERVEMFAFVSFMYRALNEMHSSGYRGYGNHSVGKRLLEVLQSLENILLMEKPQTKDGLEKIFRAVAAPYAMIPEERLGPLGIEDIIDTMKRRDIAVKGGKTADHLTNLSRQPETQPVDRYR
jgi:hypothetical protein